LKLPGLDSARIPREKITSYLLSLDHPRGRHKAVFFRRMGFTQDNWEQLALALTAHAQETEVVGGEQTPFGKRYALDGTLRGPTGLLRLIRSVWFIEDGDSAPRFVTAYPLQRRRR
jgi:hypothetical protein